MLEMMYSGCEEWDKVIKIIFLQESHHLDDFLVETKGYEWKVPPNLSSLKPWSTESWLLHLLAYLGQRWIFIFDSFLYLLSGFLTASGETCHEYSLPPVTTLEVSKTSPHLGWCWIVGSGTQACSQVLLAAAAAGFPSMQLAGRVWLLLGAKLRPLSHWLLSGGQKYREMGSLKQTLWVHWDKDGPWHL